MLTGEAIEPRVEINHCPKHAAHAGVAWFCLSLLLWALAILSLESVEGVAVGQAAPPAHLALPEPDFTKFGLLPAPQLPAEGLRIRKIPKTLAFSDLVTGNLPSDSIPLPEAETCAALHYSSGQFGVIPVGDSVRFINPGVILVKFRSATHVAAVGVEPLREFDAVQILRQRGDVEFAELDTFERRQFYPNDSLLTNQWHHTTISSYEAWDHSLGQGSVRIAIVDTPFQMNHPDLAAQVDPGWDVVNGVPVTVSSGIEHSTLCAGMAAAVIGNQLGVAGVCNCRLLPININGAISEMYSAVIWAADHGVRVVNISWTGADSEVLNTAGGYLKAKTRGILAMPGRNGTGFLNYPNQPDIYCVAMTDAADNQRSHFGNHIDFAAPGWEVFSTTINGGYVVGSGTSFSTPLFCGVVAALFSINPTLSADEAIALLKASATDLGSPGWDPYFGWGRINFAGAAAAADASRPIIAGLMLTNHTVSVTVTNQPGLLFGLWRSTNSLAPHWERVTNFVAATNANVLTLTDPAPVGDRQFYKIEARAP